MAVSARAGALPGTALPAAAPSCTNACGNACAESRTNACGNACTESCTDVCRNACIESCTNARTAIHTSHRMRAPSSCPLAATTAGEGRDRGQAPGMGHGGGGEDAAPAAGWGHGQCWDGWGTGTQPSAAAPFPSPKRRGGHAWPPLATPPEVRGCAAPVPTLPVDHGVGVGLSGHEGQPGQPAALVPQHQRHGWALPRARREGG